MKIDTTQAEQESTLERARTYFEADKVVMDREYKGSLGHGGQCASLGQGRADEQDERNGRSIDEEKVSCFSIHFFCALDRLAPPQR